MKSTCLFIPPNFPTVFDPIGGNVYYDHFRLASILFRSVVVVSNTSSFGGLHVRNLEANSVIIEDKNQRAQAGKVRSAFAIIKQFVVAGYAIKKYDLDVIYAHGIRWSGFIGAIMALLFRKPFFLYVHSATPERERLPYLRFISNIAFRFAAAAFFVSEGQCRNYLEKYKVKSSAVIGNPVDTKSFVIAERPLEEHVTKILFAGRPTPEKGFPLLLDLIDTMVSMQLNVHVTILTDTRLLSPEYERRTQKNEHVALMHYQSREKYAKIISESSFLISLSQFESFSYVVAEALACGKPVVATACDGPKDLINENNGILIPIDNLERACEATLWMIENYRKYDPHIIRNDIVSRFSSDPLQDKLARQFLAKGLL